MAIGTFAQSVGMVVRKRGLTIAAVAACAQLLSQASVRATPPAPTYLSASVSYQGPDSQWQVGWDRTPYATLSAVMNYYINTNSTSLTGALYAYQYYPHTGYNTNAYDGGSGTFIAYDMYGSDPWPYTPDQTYYITAVVTDSTGSNSSVCGVTYGT